MKGDCHMSSFVLKIIACVFMLVDHVGFILIKNNRIFRIIGRLAMPIFAFQVAQGFKHTSSKPKYILRMFLFTLISEVPFLLMFATRYLPSGPITFRQLFETIKLVPFSMNICCAFFIALCLLYCLEKSKDNKIFLRICFLLRMFCFFHSDGL